MFPCISASTFRIYTHAHIVSLCVLIFDKHMSVHARVWAYINAYPFFVCIMLRLWSNLSLRVCTGSQIRFAQANDGFSIVFY